LSIYKKLFFIYAYKKMILKFSLSMKNKYKNLSGRLYPKNVI